MLGWNAPLLPPLARTEIDRAADERDEPGLLDRLRADPLARVIAVRGDRTPLSVSGDRLHTLAPDEIGEGAEWAFLGRDDDGRALLLAALPDSAEPAAPALSGGAEWGSLRAVGGVLEAADAGLFATAVSLGRWLVDAPFCSACGTRTVIRAAGWARTCPSCRREHFPRTDPAVIVAVTSADGERILLGKNALWADRNMYSTFAGFIEAGESLESAIVREIREEAGVEVTASGYRGSQAWPYPRSLMIGFRAKVAADATATPDGVEIVDARWFDRAEVRAGLAGAGEVALPGSASIARALIEEWAHERTDP